MAIHVAIVQRVYEAMILDGRKTMECRLTRTPLPPFGRIAPGERIYFKRSAGPFFAEAVADRIWATDNLTPATVDWLKQQYNADIHGTADYWRMRRDCRYATLVWLREVRPSTRQPRYKTQNMRAWYTLDESAGPAAARPPSHRPTPRRARASFTVELTRGAINQRQVRLAQVIDHFPPRCLGGATRDKAGALITLKLKQGPVVRTDIVDGRKMLRWRGWGAWFERLGLRAGDRLRFTPQGPATFRVEPDRRHRG